MKYSEIITLAQAGFTAQQIAQMAQVEAVYQPTPAPQPAPGRSGRATTLIEEPDGTVREYIAGGGGSACSQQETVPVQQELTAQQTPDQLSAILAEMQTLKQTMQAQNRQNAELIPPTPQSAQDILSSIIAPPKKNGENKKEVNTI